MTEMFGEAWSPMSVPDLAPDDDDDDNKTIHKTSQGSITPLVAERTSINKDAPIWPGKVLCFCAIHW